jgi:uncharacterized membrane protein YgdD (TMEM256/DUF423 family)
MKTFLTVLAFAAMITAFDILILGAFLDKGQTWVELFAIFFALGALAFWGWLALENKEGKKTYKKKGRLYLK